MKRKTARKTMVVSVGYERRSPDDLVAQLLSMGVELLVDVRELPLSRRKGFSKNALAERLAASGIRYQHLRIAGNPHRKSFRDDPVKCLLLYARHLKANPAVITTVASMLQSMKAALLCYERAHSSCHRSILCDQLIANGQVEHVLLVE